MCADRVVFVPAADANNSLAWSMSRAQFSSNFDSIGFFIKAVDKKDKSQRTGWVHFQPLSLDNESAIFQEPDEPKSLHDKHMPESLKEFLGTVQRAIGDFPGTYNSLASKLNVPAF